MGHPHEFYNPAVSTRRFGVGEITCARQTEHARSEGTSDNDVTAIKFQPLQFRRASTKLALDEWFPVTFWVWMRREDRIAQAISFEIAMQTSSWTSAAPERAPPKYSAAQIQSRLDYIEHAERSWSSLFQRLKVTPLIVTYERILSTPDAVLQEIANHIGERLSSPSSPVQKHLPDLKVQRTSRNAEWRRRFLADTET